MDKDALQKYFFLGLMLAVSAAVIFLFYPLFEVIVLSMIFAIILHPIYNWIYKKTGLAGTSALIVILIFAMVIIVPASFIASKLLNESKDLYIELTNTNNQNPIRILTNVIETPIRNFISPTFTLNVEEYIGIASDFITTHLASIVSSVVGIFAKIIIIFISLYFLLKDGRKFRKILVGLSPLSDEYDEKIVSKIRQTIYATVKGVLLVALIQGILTGIGMWIFGVPNPTLWGSVSSIASLVPGLGTAIVFVPAVFYMIITGNTTYAIGLLLWGGVIVGLVDNFLSPYFYSKGAEIHQLIMLFAVLGGLVAFGPIGFIFGPIVIALFFALIDIYQTLILKKNPL